MKKQRIAISGAPATGKTTISLELERMGYKVFHEVAREIIKDSLETGSDVLPWKDVMAFSEVVWNLRRTHYFEASHEINFYDRTILDSLAYLNKEQLPPREPWALDCTELRYDKVFILPVWPEIFQTDTERMETLDECFEVDVFIREAYVQQGYELIEVPIGSVKERVAFMLGHL